MASNMDMERARKSMAQGVTLYQGTEPYIFISYAHRDFDRVIPIVKKLSEYGFRVWYDEGIELGAEWDDHVAAKVESCFCMLSFITENYLASRNCLDELSYARDLEKEQLFVYLESVKLPGRLALRFGRLQAIFRDKYADPTQFYQDLCTAEALTPAQGKAAPKKAAAAPRTVDIRAISALFEFEQRGQSITITALQDPERTTVEIPWGVTQIEERAFYECENLTTVTIPESVTAIGEDAFGRCECLTEIMIPASVESIGQWAFNGCSSLTGIWVDEDNPYFSSDDHGVLFDKHQRTLLVMPGGMTGNYFIPDGVTAIAYGAFWGCGGLEGVVIPTSVTEIDSMAFCSVENYILYGEPGSAAERYAQRNNIEFRSSLQAPLRSSAPKVNAVDMQAISSLFEYEQKGHAITITGFFDETSTAVEIPWGVTAIGDHAFICKHNLARVTIPESVTSIGKDAFCSCRSLTQIIIPASVTEIAAGAFSDCDKLKSIDVKAENPHYCSVNGVLLTKDQKTLVAVPGGFSGSYHIPETVTAIENKAFAGCRSLTGVTIPRSITVIGDGVFDSCGKLAAISLHDRVTDIGELAFYNCRGLISVEIPANVRNIGFRAFNTCINLEKVIIRNDWINFGEEVFSHCWNLTIYGGLWSRAQQYASKYHIPFRQL